MPSKPLVRRLRMRRNRRSRRAQQVAQQRPIRAATLSPHPRSLVPDPRPLAPPIPPSPTLSDPDRARLLPCLVSTHPSVLANSTVPRSLGPPPPWIPTPKMEEVYLGKERVCLHLHISTPVEASLAPLNRLWNCDQSAWGRTKCTRSQILDFNRLPLIPTPRKVH